MSTFKFNQRAPHRQLRASSFMDVPRYPLSNTQDSRRATGLRGGGGGGGEDTAENKKKNFAPKKFGKKTHQSHQKFFPFLFKKNI